ncbi:MAG TPA: cytochrome c peroxidase [Gemmatimonadales bacterium]|nr:cytochrome c peroxidase [Gemmatimonadales bacterium]
MPTFLARRAGLVAVGLGVLTGLGTMVRVGARHKLRAWPVPIAVYPATPARRVLEAGLGALQASLDSLDGAIGRGHVPEQRVAFRAARARYKRVESLLAVYGPGVASLLNGPLADETEDRPAGPLGAPAGFQVVEASLFPDGTRVGRDSLARTVRSMENAVGRFRRLTIHLDIPQAAVLDAARLEVARITSLGLAGFDAPLSGDGLVESAAALEGLRDLVRAEPRRAFWVRIDEALAAASGELATHPDFDSLDRLAFITRFANPAAWAIEAARAKLPDTLPLRRLWRRTAATIFDSAAFDAGAYAPDYALPPTTALLALGSRLFVEPRLSGPGTRACTFCHDPARAFTDGHARSALLIAGGVTPRNTPTLVNAALQPALFDDSRVGSLEAQAAAVLANPAEMGGSDELAARRLREDPSYREAFAALWRGRPDSGLTGRAVRVAIAAYVRSLVALNSRFDRAARGDTALLTASERRGFTLFMGKGHCGTCHFVPLFNGTMPPDFVTSEPEIIGVPTRPAHQGARLDPDPGRGGVDHEPAHQFAFRVPTLRNVALTAPYMHNGVFQTLEAVVDFYNRGGGSGVGARVPDQTLPGHPLHLTPEERADLIAFLGSLTDTIPPPSAVPPPLAVGRPGSGENREQASGR